MRPPLRPLLAVLALAGVAAGCGAGDGAEPATSAPPTTVEVVRDVAYAPGLLADLYLPDGGTTAEPAIVWVHGGGFTAGTKEQLGDLAATLAAQGYPGMAIQYRLAESGAWFPTDSLADPDLQAAARRAVEDAGQAVAWLGTEAAREAGVGRDQVVVAGYSAGGITAATLAAEAPTPALAGAVSLAGAAVDPARLSATTPPLLFVHGTADDVVPIALARASCDAATEAGAECRLEALEATGHSLPLEPSGPVVTAVEDFLAGLR